MSDARSGCDELFESILAQLGAAPALDKARVSDVQFAEIQAGGVAADRWAAGDVWIAAGAVPVLDAVGAGVGMHQLFHSMNN